MIKNIFIFFLCFSCYFCRSQVIIQGIVRDSATKEVVPYSLVICFSAKIGTIANETGEFVLYLPDSLKKETLKISSLGYDTTTVKADLFVASAKKEIFISQRQINLVAVTIVSLNSTKSCVEYWGNTGRKKTANGDVNMSIGSEIALYIPNDSGNTGIISTLSFFITKYGYGPTPFRAKLYYLNKTDSCPGDLIIDKEIIVQPRKNNAWAEIDITDLNITIPSDGFFVSMQWLPSAKSHPIENNVNGTQIISYGQNLGENQELKFNSTWTKTYFGNWRHFVLRNNMNAMITAKVLITCK